MNFNSPGVVNRLMDRFGTIPFDIFTILAYGPGHGDAYWNSHTAAIKRFPDGARGVRRFIDTSGPLSFTVIPRVAHEIFLLCPSDPSDFSWESSRCLMRSTELKKSIEERSGDEYTSSQASSVGGSASSSTTRVHAVPSTPSHRHPPMDIPVHPMRHSSSSALLGHSPSHHSQLSQRTNDSLPLFP
jgi:hypothetical protein